MQNRLKEIVRFRGERLFQGAVSIDWFGTDAARTKAASEAFVFHGPAYHGVQQEDVGESHGHRLVDTANFARSIVRRCYGLEDRPFTLAIAGYGTGKSHLGLTLATLLESPSSETAQGVLASLGSADEAIAADVRATMNAARQPCLVVPLNGMQNFDLTSEFTRQVVRALKKAGCDIKPIESLRPRFAQAASLIRMSNAEVQSRLLTACDADSVESVMERLEAQDELIYKSVHGFFEAEGMAIQALAGESTRDVVDVVVREYCGYGKPFRSLLVLFDEFGRYTEFATERSQIAGSGALQDLFEAVQANAGLAYFVGFIQYELSTYVQRVAPEHKTEILRYVTRFQSADRLYLSINLETLVASLLEKQQPKALNDRFDNPAAREGSAAIMDDLARWFPHAGNHRLWGDREQFHTVVRKGCWPLSPYATWTLFHLSAGGKHLQGRSALALLGEALTRHEQELVPVAREWALAPAQLWSDALEQELIGAEEGGQQGAVTHAFASVMGKHGSHLDEAAHRLLRAVVLASKLGLRAADRNDAVAALATLAGLSNQEAAEGTRLLQVEYNVLEWDDAFKVFDILGDAVPRTQFLAFVRQRVASTYDEAGKAKLFAQKANQWCDLLGPLTCDFAERNAISTTEWRYVPVCTTLEWLYQQIKQAVDRWRRATGVDEARGTVIYCYMEPGCDAAAMQAEAVKLLRGVAKEAGVPALPILAVLLHDETGKLGNAMAELAVLEDALTADDKARFGNLVAAHQEKTKVQVGSLVAEMIKRRLYATGIKDAIVPTRLSATGTELFAKVYAKPIAFPFDGFSTARGNAAETCEQLARELLAGRLDYGWITSCAPKVKNRAVEVLERTWGVFTQKGDVTRRPANTAVRSIMEKWDKMLADGERRLPIATVLRDVCMPPHGANIASAGLLLGVFVAPRAKDLALARDGAQTALSEWIQEGLFRGRFIDLEGQEGVDLVSIGGASSEWETLLDEWEQATSYSALRDDLERADVLKKRISVPSAMDYREVALRNKARAAAVNIEKMEQDQSQAIGKIERGVTQKDVSLLSWGAAELKQIIKRMEDEAPAWTRAEIEELRPHFERARQAVVGELSGWLSKQAPKDDSADAVGAFKQHMVRQVCSNFRQIGLGNEALQIEASVTTLCRRAEAFAESREAVRSVEAWMLENGNAVHTAKVEIVRRLLETGKAHASKLMGLSQRAGLPQLAEARAKLTVFLDDLKNGEAKQMRRARALWQASLSSDEDAERLLQETDELIAVFEDLPSDQEDLIHMRLALRSYRTAYQQLVDTQLTWPEFERLGTQLLAEANEKFADDELPWTPDDVIGGFVKDIGKQRLASSLAWIEGLEADSADVASLSVADANRLRDRALNPPAVFADKHQKRLDALRMSVEKRLNELAVDWLVDKFYELTPPLRRSFLKHIAEKP